MKKITTFVGIFLFFAWSCTQKEVTQIDLSGKWRFRIDSLDAGISEKWFDRTFDETVILPGSMVENGKGNKVNNKTAWIGHLRNKEWFEDENYKPYLSKEEYLFP